MELYEAKTLELYVGDKVMWTRNFKAQGIRNGQSAKITAINDEVISFTTTDGHSLSLEKSNPSLKHLDYSYVLTNYKVQGKDAKYGIGLMESYHRFSATMKNFYVQISRAIHGMILVTDNKEELVKAIGKNLDEKRASMDVISSEQLKQHETRFLKKTEISIQPVIDKKLDLEAKQLQQRKVKELDFNKQGSMVKSKEIIKELEQ